MRQNGPRAARQGSGLNGKALTELPGALRRSLSAGKGSPEQTAVVVSKPSNRFRVELTFKEVQRQEHIAFKLDGDRFLQSKTDLTVKLRHGSTYEVSITFTGEAQLGRFPVFSSRSPAYYTKRKQVYAANGKTTMVVDSPDMVRVKRSPGNDQLQGTWTCTSEVSKKRERASLHVDLEIQGVGHVDLPLQAKVYPLASQRARRGQTLNKLIFDMEFSNKDRRINITRQSYC